MDLTDIKPDKMIETSKNGQKVNDELKASLSGMQNAQDELAAAVKGATGKAIYESFTNAYNKGQTLHATLQRIIDELNLAGVQFDSMDMETAAGYSKLSADGGGTMASYDQAMPMVSKMNLNSL
ncbi:WXG100 family type VII secretion target [Nocardia sp. NPDC057440]|uniref:WXG100 family type VII secretion target n=1 Tax=Nocardia sp. NPDC057440 TaxID=3346134 RepID=UPI00366B2F3E